MARVFLCPLSKKREALLEETPGLVKDLRDAIHKREIEGAIDFGSLDAARLAELEHRFFVIGLGAWDAMRAVLDGTVGTKLKRDARILGSKEVAKVAATMTHAPEGKPKKGSFDALARDCRHLFRSAQEKEEGVLVIGASLADRTATAAKAAAALAKRVEASEEVRERGRRTRSRSDPSGYRVGAPCGLPARQQRGQGGHRAQLHVAVGLGGDVCHDLVGPGDGVGDVDGAPAHGHHRQDV